MVEASSELDTFWHVRPVKDVKRTKLTLEGLKSMDTMEQPVVEETPVKTEEKAPAVEAAKPSPAQDLRNIQMLLISGIYPGNVAPQIVQAYQLLESMAQKIEKEANEVK